MIYFDNAATTFPKPDEVYEAVNNCLKNYCGNPGRSGHKISLEAGRLIIDTRELIAELFNIKNIDRIIFTLNATDSFNIALKGFLKPGDHVIISSMEHNSLARPLKALERHNIETSVVKCNNFGEIELSDIENEIKANTVLIAVTHASNIIGTILPIKQIGGLAKKRNIKFMVDSAQTAGVYDVDVIDMNIDFLIFTGHKGLYGPQGVGGLYISENVDIESYREGGTGSSSESLLQPTIYPDKLESGTPNTPGIAGLNAGIKFIKRIGMKSIRKYEEDIMLYFLNKLRDIDAIKIYGRGIPAMQSAVVSINIGSIGSSDISFLLDNNFEIATRSGLHCAPLAHKTIGTLEQGTVRFSFGYFNTVKEIDKAIEALKKITEMV